MVTSEPQIILRKIYDAFNQRNPNALDELLAENFVDYTAGPEQKPGIEGMQQVWSRIWSKYPLIRIVVEDMFGESDKVVARVNLVSSTPGGEQAIGRAIEMFRVVDGRAVELWNLIDFY